MPTTAPCPTCGKQVIWNSRSRWRPFCSERCRLIDLGDWLDETHRISDGGPAAEDPADATPWPSADNGDDTPRH